jgi:ABC-2 type transport system ATP-binding protein
VLELDHVTKTYLPPSRWLRPFIRVAANEPVHALREATFSVLPGEVVGLVGPNGAGKTTLIKIIGTLLEPTSGRASVAGFDVVDQAMKVRERIGVVLADERGLYWRLSGRRNLELFGVLNGLTRADARSRAEMLLDLVDLADRDKLVFGYSSGMRTRLNLARALMTNPQVLILDEPTRSLDPLAASWVGELLRRLAGEGHAVLMASHRLDEVETVCDRAVVLLGGEIRHVGSVNELNTDGRGAARRLVEMLAADEPT